jgi:hypothetical protein
MEWLKVLALSSNLSTENKKQKTATDVFRAPITTA